MLREILNNLFSTTSSRGRLEYAVVTAGLSAAVFLFGAFGFAAYPVKAVAFPLFFAATAPLAALWFVAAQRVRDIGWNVPLVLVGLLAAFGLSSFGGLTQDGAVFVIGGPWAAVSAGLTALLTFVPGQHARQSKAAPALA